MAKEQAQGAKVQPFHTVEKGLEVLSIPCNNAGPYLLSDVSIGHPRPIVAGVFQRQVSETVNNLAHPGQKSTAILVSKKFVWAIVRERVRVRAKVGVRFRVRIKVRVKAAVKDMPRARVRVKAKVRVRVNVMLFIRARVSVAARG